MTFKTRFGAAYEALRHRNSALANVLSKVTVYEDVDTPTFGVSEGVIAAHPAFVKSLLDEELLRLLTQCALNLANNVPLVRKYDAERWSTAAEYCNNSVLIKEGGYGSPLKGALYNPDYNDETAEEIYRQLGEKYHPAVIQILPKPLEYFSKCPSFKLEDAGNEASATEKSYLINHLGYLLMNQYYLTDDDVKTLNKTIGEIRGRLNLKQ